MEVKKILNGYYFLRLSDKILCLVKSIFLIKNWFNFSLDYLGIHKSINYTFRNGLKINLLRIDNSDFSIALLTDVFLRKEYGSVPDNAVIMDIGANIGAFTMYSIFGKNNYCYSFEPEIQNFEKLKENIEINNLSKRVKLYNLAVSDNCNEKKLYKFESVAHSFTRTGDNFEIVKCTDLNSFIELNNIKQIDYLKIDCEGAEFEILYSIKDDFLKRIRFLCVEYHNYSSKPTYDGESLLNFLKTKNFNILDHRRQTDGLLGIIKCESR